MKDRDLGVGTGQVRTFESRLTRLDPSPDPVSSVGSPRDFPLLLQRFRVIIRPHPTDGQDGGTQSDKEGPSGVRLRLDPGYRTLTLHSPMPSGSPSVPVSRLLPSPALVPPSRRTLPGPGPSSPVLRVRRVRGESRRRNQPTRSRLVLVPSPCQVGERGWIDPVPGLGQGVTSVQPSSVWTVRERSQVSIHYGSRTSSPLPTPLHLPATGTLLPQSTRGGVSGVEYGLIDTPVNSHDPHSPRAPDESEFVRDPPVP